MKQLVIGIYIRFTSFHFILQFKVRIVVKEWQFSDGSHSLNNFRVSSQQSHNGPTHVLSTGRKLYITVMEGKNLAAKDKSGKFEPYVKLQYGKVGDTGSI